MDQNLKVMSTAYPDGSVVIHVDGMSRVPLVNTATAMKKAAFRAANTIRKGGIAYQNLSPGKQAKKLLSA